jgi:hypothetical protein
VHLIDSANRGPTLEVTLTKLMKVNPGLQVLALSATIGNAKALAKWLKAELVVSDWRPTVLKEGVFFGRAINFKEEKRVLNAAGPDEVLSLVSDTLEEGGQCLVFANTRKSSESIAQKVSRHLARNLSDADKARYDTVRQQIMKHAETDIDQKLAECVSYGVAFHHAGPRGGTAVQPGCIRTVSSGSFSYPDLVLWPTLHGYHPDTVLTNYSGLSVLEYNRWPSRRAADSTYGAVLAKLRRVPGC